MRPIARRATSLLAVPALALTALATTSSPATAATDPAPAQAAAGWLSGQLTDGAVVGQYGPDYGLSIDTALALDAVGGHEDDVTAVSDNLAAHLSDYITGEAYGDAGSHYAGATAKALWLAEVVGADPHSYGGVDLQQTLEDLVTTDGPAAGRIADVSTYGDYANAIGQIFAVESLTALGSDRAASARDFLLEQQCGAGFVRLDFTPDKTAADQTCDGGTADQSDPDTDVTALFVLGMRQLDADPAVAAAVDRAVAWLQDQQRANGSFGGGPTTEAPNANSTGLAGWALGEAGDADAAADAAAWVRAHQAANVANCVYYASADLGAIAYDGAARRALQSTPIDEATADQFRRATAQALPVLQWAPAGGGDPHALFAAEYVKAGGRERVGVIGATPGEALCAMLGEQSVLGYAGRSGQAHLPVRIPSKTAKSRVSVANAAGTFGTVTINALGKKRLDLTIAKRRVAGGERQTIKLSRLAPGELARIRVAWPTGKVSGAAGQANRRGVFKVTVKVPKRPGTATVRARGQFADRKAPADTFTVTR